MNIHDLIEANNGEIRIIPARYESGYYCLVTYTDVVESLFELFTDLVAGDNSHEIARAFFNEGADGFGFARAGSIHEALDLALLNAGISYAQSNN